MTTVDAFARRRDLKAMDGFLKHLEIRGSEHLKIGITEFAANAAFYMQQEVSDSFPRILMLAISEVDGSDDAEAVPLGMNAALTPVQSDYLARLIAIAAKHSASQDFLDSLLHEASMIIQDPCAFQMLMSAGASPDTPGQSRKGGNGTKPFVEALLHGNTAAACALLSTYDRRELSKLVEAISEGSRELGFSAKQFKALPQICGQENCLGAPGGGGELLQRLEDAVTPAVLVGLRREILTSYLRATRNSGAPWSMDVVTGIAAGSGGSLDDSFMAVALRTLEDGRSAACNDDLLNEAIASHCFPILEAAGDALKVDAQGEVVPKLRIDVAFNDVARQVKTEQDKARLIMTLQLLVDGGQPINGAANQRPLLAQLAAGRNPDAIEERLVALLTVGCDPELIDSKGRKPGSMLTGEIRRKWDEVTRSYGVRKKTLSILDNLTASCVP